MCLSLSLNSLISVLSCFYSLLIKATSSFSGNQLNQFCSLVSLVPFSVILHWLSLYLQSLQNTQPQFTSAFCLKHSLFLLILFLNLFAVFVCLLFFYLQNGWLFKWCILQTAFSFQSFSPW